jgi:type IV pilus biogenesis protein CpaD/CtpE
MKTNPMKTLSLIILIAALGAGCGKKENAEATQPEVAEKPQKLITDPIVENKICKELKKPKGELTQADLERVTRLDLGFTEITDAGIKELAKLQKLAKLDLL